MLFVRRFALASLLVAPAAIAAAAAPVGYYRQPSIHGGTIVFVAEGDLWKVGIDGGVATRLTSHPGEEERPAISPDGGTVAFTAQYEGPTEVYTMPLDGGLPVRWTYDASRVDFVGWTPDGRILAATEVFSTLPDAQLTTIDVSRPGGSPGRTLLPLAQAADGCYDAAGKTLFFTRLPFQGSHTKRYEGGTAQQIWRFADGDAEARPLTADYPGTSKNPMWWADRIYFLSDRDGTMNLWSMDPDGRDLRQLTRNDGWDASSASLSDGRIAYQLGADVHVVDIASGRDRIVPITLDSDLDQTREHWLKSPIAYMTSSHLSPDGDRVAITARGRVFVAPRLHERLIEAGKRDGVRYRDARFLPDGKGLFAMSDESGEVEFWRLPANGVGEGERLTTDGTVMRWGGVPSPDGKYLAHYDKDQRLYLLDLDRKENRKIDESPVDDFGDLAWSPDSRWLAYVVRAENLVRQVKIFHVDDASITPATTDRFDSYSPAWSRDGKWLYLLSDRSLKSVSRSVWGPYEPEPFLDRTTRIYQIALAEGARSPFAPPDELHPAEKSDGKEQDKEKGKRKGTEEESEEDAGATPPDVRIDLAGIRERLIEVPVPPGDYSALAAGRGALYWVSWSPEDRKGALEGVKVGNEDVEVKTILDDVKRFELSGDAKKFLIQKGEKLYVVDAKVGKADLEKKEVDLSGWSLSVIPRVEWRQMFTEAWRLERDYFYDPGMHGVDWKAIRGKYEPLVDRVTSRRELSDLLGLMVSEVSALHTYVYGGEMRSGPDSVNPASLGALLARDERAGGYRVGHVYRGDPDEPDRLGPLSRPGVDVSQGDVIEQVDGEPALSAPDLGALLRQKGGRQVLLRVRPAGGGDARDVIVSPVSAGDAVDLRYREWEYTRRQMVEEEGGGDIGYVHLRAMGAQNFTEWAKGYYPAFNRKGLIVDVRHNQGGNIDSWIIARLLRKAWSYWSQRVGRSPVWNMQYAFRGHVVVLCDAFTASDGEEFCEGIKRLGIGKVIGARTWGGEIWLSSDNVLVDNGIATAAESGVYGPDGTWLVEGHGVDPDSLVDDPPHATFSGGDAQLEAAIAELQREIREKPVEPPPQPAYPNKAFRPR